MRPGAATRRPGGPRLPPPSPGTSRPNRTFDPALGIYGRWFPGGWLNTCYNAVDRHVAAGRGAQPAIIWDSPMTGRGRDHHLCRPASAASRRLAGALAAAWRDQGERVIIYMPMVPEAAIAMLACARLGAVHSVVFGGFAAAELAARIADATPRAIVTASCGLEPGRVVKYKPLIDAAIGPLATQARRGADPATPRTPLRPDARAATTDLLAADGRRRPAPLRQRGGDRPALYPLHLGHDGRAEGHPARQWRACRRAASFDVDGLWRRRGGRVLGGLGCRLGGRPSYIVYAPLLGRLHHGAVRGQAGRHARCRHLLARV